MIRHVWLPPFSLAALFFYTPYRRVILSVKHGTPKCETYHLLQDFLSTLPFNIHCLSFLISCGDQRTPAEAGSLLPPGSMDGTQCHQARQQRLYLLSHRNSPAYFLLINEPFSPGSGGAHL